MIQLQITGRHFELDPKITKYVNQKIAVLDKFFPKKNIQSHGAIVLHLDKSNREDNECVAEITLEFPGQTFMAKEETLNMYAAVDICEAKLKAQILKYKDKHTPSRNRGRKLFAKLWSSEQATTEPTEQ